MEEETEVAEPLQTLPGPSGSGAALPVAVLALISRLRGAPAKLRSFFLMGLMVIYMIFMLVEMFSAD